MNLILALLWIGSWFTPPLLLAVWVEYKFDQTLSLLIGLDE